MQNSFTGLVPACTNRGIHAIVDEAMSLRMQLVKRPERDSLSGWNDALNFFMLQQLEKLRKTVARVTYNPSGSNPEDVRSQRMAEAGDVNVTLGSLHNDGAVHYDDLMLAVRERQEEFPYDFSGADRNIPQPTPEFVPNHWLRTFIRNLDAFVVHVSRLDSRHEPGTVNPYESAQITMLLQGLYAMCLDKGGAFNRNDTPDGVTPLQETQTFNFNGEFNGALPTGGAPRGGSSGRPPTPNMPAPPQPITPPT